MISLYHHITYIITDENIIACMRIPTAMNILVINVIVIVQEEKDFSGEGTDERVVFF